MFIVEYKIVIIITIIIIKIYFSLDYLPFSLRSKEYDFIVRREPG
jgi:hypothetical protein